MQLHGDGIVPRSSGHARRRAAHLDDAAVAALLDLPSVTDVVGEAFVAWGEGRAATTQRVRAEAGGEMASAMAAVAPPYSGGKVYATHHGVFTFVNVLFDIEGRLLCTLGRRRRSPVCAPRRVRAWRSG